MTTRLPTCRPKPSGDAASRGEQRSSDSLGRLALVVAMSMLLGADEPAINRADEDHEESAAATKE